MKIKLQIEKLTIKNGKLTGAFISKHNSAYYESKVFGTILQYVQKSAKICKLREHNQKLTLSFENVDAIPKAIHVLQQLVVAINATSI